HPYSLFLLLLICLLAISPTAWSQGNWGGGSRGGGQSSKGLVKGFIFDQETNVPLEFATVSIHKVADSSLVSGTITDDKGLFKLEVLPGRYYLSVDYLAYESKKIDGIEVKQNKLLVDIGRIILGSDAEALQEIEVRAERSQMQLSLDKKVYNVGSDMAAQGGTAADILDNVPSVTVDIEGNVNLRGSGNVRILVDGKPSTLIGISNSDGLRQLPANLIEKIEVVTNPSARYEAEGQSGIINIVLSKKQKKGLNGNFNINTGWPHNHGTSFNVNYRKDKFNWFLNYGVQYRERPGFGSLNQQVFSDAQTTILVQDSDRRRTGISNSIRGGADFSFTPKDILTGSFIYRISNDDNFVETRYEDFINTLDNPTLLTIRTDDEIELEPNLEYSLNYKKEFLLKGREWTVDLQFRESTETESSDFNEATYNPDETPTGLPALIQRSANEEGEQTWLFQSDYIHPIGEKGKFEAGWRTQLRNINNDFLVEEFDNGEWLSLEGLSNDFRYDEDIHAVYVLYGNKLGRWSYQAGIRMEHSRIKTNLITTGEVNERNFTDWFPSALLNYELPKANSIQVSYSRRIRRPRFWDLNPFFTFSDNRNFFAGNPNLNPEYTDSYELEHIKYWDQVSITSAVYYRHSTGWIQRIRRVADDGTSVTRPENLSTNDSWGAEFT
ncbi:MAG: TonB-dependent receptor, partial [Bacteroidota bacterium]